MKFIQPVSMPCTQEQYLEYLKEPLQEMGYQEASTTEWERDECKFIATNFDGNPHHYGNICELHIRSKDRYVLSTFNPQLFLAIAAMTSEPYGIPGEYWTFQGMVNIHSFNLGKVYRSQSSLDKPKAFIDNYGVYNGCYDKNATIFFRKSTLDELVSQLADKSTKEENMAQKSFKTTRQAMCDVWNVACIDWKPRIEQLVKEYGRVFSDEVELPFEAVKEMFDAATKEQESTLCKIFPTYLKHKNAWVGDVSEDEMSEISEKIFRSSSLLQVATLAADSIGRPDLKERAFYVTGLLDVKVHKTSSDGHVIEFIRK